MRGERAGGVVLAAVSGILLLLGSARGGAAQEERFRWRGDVDGIDEVVVRGDTVRVEHVDADPVRNAEYEFTAPLPSRAVQVRLEILRGRGRVRVMEQPSERNEFTAVVRIEDTRSGDNRYEFELVWDEEDNRDYLRPDRVDGKFRWKGRVDKAAAIEIRGGSHTVRDEGGQGTTEYEARFESTLPEEVVQILVEKLDGRGDVQLVQAPREDNGFTAVVRIEDERGGADDYELELRWRR